MRQCNNLLPLVPMEAEYQNWQGYLSLHQHLSAQLHAAPSPTALYQAAIALSQQRLALGHPPSSLFDAQPATVLPPGVWQTEMLLFYARHYAVSANNTHLLLLAGWSCALIANIQHAAIRAPALATAKYLAACNQAQQISQVLSACYPTERKLTPWRQDILSLLLTETDYFRHSHHATLRQQLAQRLMLSNSEYELALLRPLLEQDDVSLAAAPITAQNLLQTLAKASCYNTLSRSDNRTIEHHLQTEPQLASTVLAIASKLNRQQQAVSHIRLAISMIGRDNLTDSLAVAELHDYLSRLRHPWHSTLLQFCHCMTTALKLVLPLSSVRCQLLATCLMVPLWLNERFARSALVRRTAEGYQRNFTPVIIVQSERYRPQLAVLLQLYQLKAFSKSVGQWQHSVDQTARPDEPDAKALQLAWQLSLQLYCGITATAPPTLNQGPSPETPYQKLLSQLVEQSQCYSPLQLDV